MISGSASPLRACCLYHRPHWAMLYAKLGKKKRNQPLKNKYVEFYNLKTTADYTYQPAVIPQPVDKISTMEKSLYDLFKKGME